MGITTSEIAEAFIRAAEIERACREHVGPKPVRSLNLGYVHSWADKAAWRKEPGDKLMTLDPYADERKAFWERLHSMPSAAELSKMESLHQWLTYAGDDRKHPSDDRTTPQKPGIAGNLPTIGGCRLGKSQNNWFGGVAIYPEYAP